MELRLTTVVVALAFIGLVSSVPHHRQQNQHENNQLTGRLSEQQITQLLRQIDERVKNEVTPDVPAKFSELVAALKHLPHNVISSIDRQVRQSGSFSSRKLADIWDDALIMDASEGSLKLITRQIMEQSVSSARKNYLLTMMALVKKPTAGSVRAVIPLLEQSHVSRQTLLGVSSLISNARKHGQVEEKDLSDAVNAIVKYLKQHESSQDKVIAALKALQNLRSIEDALPTIATYAADSNVKNSIRVAAMDALRAHAASRFVQDKVMSVYFNERENSEVRIAAYQVLASHADQSIVRRVLDSLNRESDKQVGAFVTSHLANLKESSAPRHQAIRRILESEQIPTQRFPSDLRKYSRNVELSHHTKTLGLGAVVDADLVYDRSIAPRSVRFNLSLPMYDREINVVEVGLRQSGFEGAVKKLLSQDGPLAGKNMPQIFSEIADFVSSDSMNDISKSRVKYQRSTKRPQENGQQSEVEASMYLNLDGNTVAYFDLADAAAEENDMTIVVKSLKNQLHSADWSQFNDRAFAFMFHKQLEIPTGNGYKPVAVNGSIVLGFKVDRHGLYPSMAAQLSTRTPQKHIIQKINSSPALRFKVENNKLTVSLPRDEMNILTISNEAYEVDAQGNESPIQMATRELNACSKSLHQLLGVEVCAKLTGPQKMWKQEAPCFAPWIVQVAVSKSDSRMEGWEMSWEMPRSGKQGTWKLAFDTPRSSIKRNVAVQLEVSEEPSTLKCKVQLPRRELEGSVAYRYSSDEMYGKFEWALEKNQLYSVEAGLKSNLASKKSEWIPMLKVVRPRTQPLTLTGTLGVQSGRKNQIAFDLHNNAQNNRKFIKGSIAHEGNLWTDLKVATTLEAELEQMAFKLFGMADKNRDGSAHTDVKVEYRLPNSKNHQAKFVAKIQNLSAGSITKINSFVELQMTQFPEKNVHISWNVHHKRDEQMENEFIVMWRDQMNDPRRKIHILQNSKFAGIRKGRVASSDNIISIDIAPLDMKYEVKAFGHLERGELPNYKLTLEVNDKINNKDAAASWEYRHTSRSPLKMSIDASLMYPGRQLKYSDKIEEISPKTYKGATKFQWADNKKLTHDYVFKVRSEGESKVYQLEADIKSPSLALKHASMMKMSPREMQLNTRMNNQQEKLWDLEAHLTKDDKSAIRFEVTGVKGKMEVSPFGSQKSSQLEVEGKNFKHYSKVAIDRVFTISSKTMKDNKPIFVLNSNMNQENIIAGPHDWEVRFQAPKSRSGEQKIKVHHEIGNGQAKGTVAYFVKNQEKASLEAYASGKSNSANVQVSAGVTFKTEYKYHSFDGFHFGFDHRLEKSAGNRGRFETTVRADFGQDTKHRMTVSGEKEGNMKNGQLTGKVIVETPVYDFKHQEAEIKAQWNREKTSFEIKGANTQNKVVRVAGEFENRNGRMTGRVEGESEIHKRKTQATFTAEKGQVALDAQVDDKEMLRAQGKVNYNSPRDFSAAVQGKWMNSPLYHGETEARSSGKQVAYKVEAKKDGKTYALGKMTVDTTRGCDAKLQMELTRRNARLSFESRAARDLLQGPHSFELQLEADNLKRQTVRLTHEIKNNKMRQNVVYVAGEAEKFNMDSAIFYKGERQGRATKHSSDMEITIKMPRMSYTVKHAGELKADKQSVQFKSDAKVQDKQTWTIEGDFSKSDKSSLTFNVRDVAGKFQVSPFGQTKYAKAEIRSQRYTHDSELEMTPRKAELKLHSKSTANNQVIYKLDIVRVAGEPNRLVFESKMLDAQMECDLTKEPMTASFNYNGKTSDRTVAKAAMSASKDSFTLNAEGKCKYSKKYTTSLKGRKSNTHASVDGQIEEDGRERLAASARYETKDGFKGELSLKKDGRELASTRTSLSKIVSEGPNDWELVYNGDESIKVHHENNGRLTASLVHTKANQRRHFVEVAALAKINRDSATLEFDMGTEFAKKIFNIQSSNLKLKHQHDFAGKKFSSKTTGKALINKEAFDASVDANIDPEARINIEMIAQSPRKNFEKQSASLEANWSRDSVNGQARLQSSAGCLLKINANSQQNNQRARQVSGKILIETPNKKMSRQEGEFNAQWSESSASFALSATDSQNRKIKVTGESEMKDNIVLVRGQCDSEFPQIKPSFIEVRGDRESANVLVKFNGKEILSGQGKMQFTNWEKFNAELKGKARSSPAFLVKAQSTKIADSTKLTASVSKDDREVATLEVERSMAHGLKHNIEIRLPTMKTHAALKSELSKEAVHGPHSFEIEVTCPKYGKRVASLTHKVQDDRVKCSLLYTKNAETVLNIEHSGSYKAEVGPSQKRLSMDADVSVKVYNKLYKVHHMGDLKINRNSVQFQSEAKSNGKSAWATKGLFSRTEMSHWTVTVGDHNGEMRINPFGQNKQIQIDIRSPHYAHHTEGQFDCKTWELRASSKIQRAAEKLMEFECERRQEGTAKINLDSVWGNYRAEYDVRREPMTAFVTIKTKNVKPAVDMKITGSLDRNTVELAGEYKDKQTYSGSIRASQSPTDYQIDVYTKKNDKPLYSARANASGRNDGGVKANVRFVRKDKEVARVTVSLAEEIAQGPHEIEIQLPSEKNMKIRHEVLAGLWKASATHMERGVKKGYVEASGRATGTWKKADITLNFKGETQGKKIMNIAELSLGLKHQHDINKYGFDATSQLKGFINRKDDLNLRVASSVDVRRKAALAVTLQTPLNEYKNQELEVESNWNGRNSFDIKGKMTNSAGKTVEMKGNVAARSSRLIVNGNVKSQIKAIPSMNVDASADSKGFYLNVDKNEKRAFQVEGQLKSAQWSNVDASIRGKRSSGPTYSASIKGTYEKPEASYEFVTRQDEREVMAARANAQITNSDDWTTGFQLTSNGSEMASFGLEKGQCNSGHKSYTATYSRPNMEPRQHQIHEADVEPLFRSLRKIRGL